MLDVFRIIIVLYLVPIGAEVICILRPRAQEAEAQVLKPTSTLERFEFKTLKKWQFKRQKKETESQSDRNV